MSSYEPPVFRPVSAQQNSTKNIKVVLVGDSGVGKSSLIAKYLHDTFTENCETTVYDVSNGVKNVDQMQF